ANVQHRLRPQQRPVHPRPFHPVFHGVAARPLDHPTGDRVALGQVLIVTHPRRVLLEVPADRLHPLPFRRPHAASGPHPPPRPPPPPSPRPPRSAATAPARRPSPRHCPP